MTMKKSGGFLVGGGEGVFGGGGGGWAAGGAAARRGAGGVTGGGKLVAAVKDSFAFCTAALAKVDDSKLGEQFVMFGNRPMSRGGALVALGGSWTDHYATQAIYLRLNGILPPTAQPAKKD